MSGLRRVEVDELAREPVGKYVAGATYAHFCAAPELWGVILWGRPNERDALALGRSLVLELAAPAVPHVSIVDASRIESGDPGAFHAAERYLTHYATALEAWVRRVALVRPAGLRGALVAGAYEVLPRPYPVAVFADADAALAWLDAEPASAALLGAVYADAAGVPPLVGTVRAYLHGHLADAELPAVARELGMSPRTLQRKLGEAGTTLKDEMIEARVRVARRLLVETDAPLTAIAYDVGCASLQHFSALFRRRTGESPSAYRARCRARAENA